MNFWDRVDSLLDNKGMTRKELAAEAQFDVSSIGKGKSNKEDRSPNADIAVRIANVLGTTVEYLVSGSISGQKQASVNLDTIYRFEKTIRSLSCIPEQQRAAIEQMIEDLGSSYTPDTSK